MSARARTTRAAVERLLEKGLLPQEETHSLVIHFLGVDEHELTGPGGRISSSAELSETYNDLLEFAAQRGYTDLHLTFVGPNLSPSLHRHEESFKFGAQSLNVHVLADTRCYHEFAQHAYPRSTMLSPTRPLPSLCVLFNAGLWGYDSWTPTLLEFMSAGSPLLGVPLVVTSYTLEESEDDYDVMDAIARAQDRHSPDGSKTTLEWAWDCEENPNKGCAVERSTQPAGREYVDSGYWQACAATVTRTFELDTAAGGGVGGSVSLPPAPRLFGQCSEVH